MRSNAWVAMVTQTITLFVTFDTSSSSSGGGNDSSSTSASPLSAVNTEDETMIRGKERAAEGGSSSTDGNGGSANSGQAGCADDVDIDDLFDSLQNAVISALLEPEPP